SWKSNGSTSTTGDRQQTVLRFTPCLFGLYTMVVLLYLQLLHHSSPLTTRAVFWRGKSTVTFSDMIMCVRRTLWNQWYSYTPSAPQEFSKLSPALQEMTRCALDPTAELASSAVGDTRHSWPSLTWEKGKSRTEKLSEKVRHEPSVAASTESSSCSRALR